MTPMTPRVQRIYDKALRVIVLREAVEEAEAEFRLALGDMTPEATGATAILLIARAAGRSCPYMHLPIVSVTLQPEQHVALAPVKRRRGRPPKKASTRSTS